MWQLQQLYTPNIFAVGLKERCDRLCVDLNQTIPVKHLGESKWYGGCRYSRDRERDTLTISRQSFAEELVKISRVSSVQTVPLRVGVKLEEFNEDEETKSWPFYELIGGLTWLAISTRPDISNAVRSVSRYCSAPKAIHWKAALGVLALHIRTGASVDISLVVLPTQTTPVKQPTGGLCQAEQLCVKVHVCVGFPGRRNVSPVLHLRQNILLLATQ